MLLIKDMELPRSCGYCRLKDYTYSECMIKHKRINTWDRSIPKPKWCPLIAVEQTENGTYKEI